MNDAGANPLTHLDARGNACMVDVAQKTVTARSATATARVRMRPETLRLIASGGHKKGDVLAVARVAGIQAAKRCAELIPLCHPLLLASASIEFESDETSGSLVIHATCQLMGQTGVEMEALTAVSIAALTVYDMCKAVDRGMVIENLCLLEKTGGQSGTWRHAAE